MLSRVAESIYWMSRYVERAENVARFIDVNLNLMLDAPDGAGRQWQPLVNTTGDHEDFAQRCREVETGARNVDHILTGTLLPEISRELLARMAEGSKLSRVHVTVGSNGFQYEIN